MCNTVGYGHTLRLAWAIECTMDNGTPQCLMEIGRGGACVPARVAPQGRIRRSLPVCDACIFGMETPLRGRSGGHTGAAPTISRMAPCPKVASEQFADGQKREKVAGE